MDLTYEHVVDEGGACSYVTTISESIPMGG